MHSRMVPQVLTSPGRMLLLDGEGCLSLEAQTKKVGDDLVAEIRDHDLPGQREPRRASFYSVSDRALFIRALFADRLRDMDRRCGFQRFRYRPRLVQA